MDQDKDIFMMSREEIRRYQVIRKVLEHGINQQEASEYLGLTDRQIRRIVKRVRSFGERGVIHKLRGRAGNRCSTSAKGLDHTLSSDAAMSIIPNPEMKRRTVLAATAIAAKKAVGSSDDQEIDFAQTSTKLKSAINDKLGGIDLSSDKALIVQNNGQGIKFHIDPAQLKELENAPGFVPVIISIKPMTNIRLFIGLNTQSNDNYLKSANDNLPISILKTG